MLLKNILLNCQDLFIFLDKFDGESMEEVTEHAFQLLTTSFTNNKELSKVYQIAELILSQSPQIVSLVEVGGKESLDNFNKYFLESKYKVFHHPSNSNRGIDTGFLVINELAKNVELKHINNKKLKNGKKFSRGLLRLKVKLKDKNLHLLLCHLKSKLDLKKEDYEGRSQRHAEVKAVIVEANRISKNDPDSMVAVLGDLNGIIYKEETEVELQDFKKNGYIDLLEEKQVDILDRTTYTYFKANGDRFLMQLDYVLGNKNFRSDVKNSFIMDFDGNNTPILPKSRKERMKLPSDHFPYYFEIN